MPDAPDADVREGNHEVDAPAAPTDEVAAAVVARVPGAVAVDSHGQAVVHVPLDAWHDVAQLLRNEERFTQCLDVCAVDHLVDAARVVPPGVDAERFEVVANFLSHPRNRRVRVIAQVPVGEPNVATIADLYPGIAFAERETFDLFGITFTGHDDLARILMPDDWVGHPLRKDDAPARVPVTFKEDPSPR